MTVPKTLTEAANAQPATIQVIPGTQTSTNVRELSYSDEYRGSNEAKETPVQRLQRMTASA